MKLIIRLKKRKKPIPEFERLAQIKNEFKRELFIFMEASRLRIHYQLILLTPAKEIKKWKLKRIIKDLKALRNEQEEADKREMEFIDGNPRGKVNYKIAGVTDSKARKEKE